MKKHRHQRALLMMSVGTVISVLIATALAIVAVRSSTAFKTSFPGQIVRHFQGEPGATQSVNDAADLIIASGWEPELLSLSDQLMAEYGPIATTLPEEMFAGGYSIPLERLPQKFHALRWATSNSPPNLVLRLDETTATPTAIILSWGNMRHAVIVYAQPPTVTPQGFFVRQVGDRIYVIANES